MILIILGTLLQINHTIFKENAEFTNAQIKDIVIIRYFDYGRHHNRIRPKLISKPHAFVTFTVDNIEYSGYISEYDKSLESGDLVGIYYNANNPNYFISENHSGYINIIFFRNVIANFICNFSYSYYT